MGRMGDPHQMVVPPIMACYPPKNFDTPTWEHLSPPAKSFSVRFAGESFVMVLFITQIPKSVWPAQLTLFLLSFHLHQNRPFVDIVHLGPNLS